MIESYYWKQDLLKYAKQFRYVSKPPRWSERLQVNFEKDVTIAFYMVRKLMECTKLSSKTMKYNAQIYRSPCVQKVNNLNFGDIGELYDLENEEPVYKNVKFVCNQFIHGGAMFAYRESDRNWGGLYTCSNFELNKFVYRIPLDEIRRILKIAGNDYPSRVSLVYNENMRDFIVTTD